MEFYSNSTTEKILEAVDTGVFYSLVTVQSRCENRNWAGRNKLLTAWRDSAVVQAARLTNWSLHDETRQWFRQHGWQTDHCMRCVRLTIVIASTHTTIQRLFWSYTACTYVYNRQLATPSHHKLGAWINNVLLPLRLTVHVTTRCGWDTVHVTTRCGWGTVHITTRCG